VFAKVVLISIVRTATVMPRRSDKASLSFCHFPSLPSPYVDLSDHQSAESRAKEKASRKVQVEFMIGSKRMYRRIVEHIERAGRLAYGTCNPILQAVNSQRRDDR
jgi:hypothetical protein